MTAASTSLYTATLLQLQRPSYLLLCSSSSLLCTVFDYGEIALISSFPSLLVSSVRTHFRCHRKGSNLASEANRKNLYVTVECAGYIARIFSHFDTKALGPYIVQTMLILVAPPLFAASIYMTLGRVIVALNCQQLSIVPVRFLTKIFVVGDVISFLLQCGGIF